MNRECPLGFEEGTFWCSAGTCYTCLVQRVKYYQKLTDFLKSRIPAEFHEISYCGHCDGPTVICGYCNNNSCNGGTGTFDDGTECGCEEAHEELEKYYKGI